ncbi:hypothetical protein [Skermanella pratensis]|nr:hypothetical protein [Skermanella pratensis]
MVPDEEHPTILVIGLLLTVALMGAAANMIYRGSQKVVQHTAWLL